jgi:predicted transglutaminase-like cysteine proteinase
MAFVIRSCLIIVVFVATLLFARSAQCASSDPFGGHHTREVVYSSVFEKWFATINKLSRDHALLSACIDSNVTECAAGKRLSGIIEDAKTQNGLAVLGHINRAINFEIKPVARSDWLSPFEAINSGGDCKAYSISKYFALLEAGVAADRLRLVIVHARGQSDNHMVVAALWQEHWLILDNLTPALVPDEASEYEPLLVLDDKGMRSYLDPAVNY